MASQLIFEEDTLFNRILHNETAFIARPLLQHVGVPMVVLPVRLDLRRRGRLGPAPGLSSCNLQDAHRAVVRRRNRPDGTEPHIRRFLHRGAGGRRSLQLNFP